MATKDSSKTSDEFLNLAQQILESETAAAAVNASNTVATQAAAAAKTPTPRIPAPLNITEIGGYINLMRELNQEAMLRQVLASILGAPTPEK